MKKVIYIGCFILLGLLLQFLAHALVEIWYIGLLLKDFTKYCLGWSWGTWYGIHSVGTWTLVLLGMVFGYWQGRHWWNRLYDEQGKLKYLKCIGND